MPDLSASVDDPSTLEEAKGTLDARGFGSELEGVLDVVVDGG